jgi:Collagen triple helix repeat (20 copies)
MRRRLSYANVTATLALVFAMSGGAMAANSYLINSTKQISPKVLKKLTGKAGKTGANGAAGTTGATGPQGKEGQPGKEGTPGTEGHPGAPATTLFAYVQEEGTLVRGTPGTTVEKLGASGNEYYEVNFPTDVSRCVPEISLGNSTGNGTDPGIPLARMFSDEGAEPKSAVEVDIFETAGTKLIRDSFNLIVIC